MAAALVIVFAVIAAAARMAVAEKERDIDSTLAKWLGRIEPVARVLQNESEFKVSSGRTAPLGNPERKMEITRAGKKS